MEDWSARRRREEGDLSDIEITEEEEQPVVETQHGPADVDDAPVQDSANVRRSTRTRKRTDFYQAGGR